MRWCGESSWQVFNSVLLLLLLLGFKPQNWWTSHDQKPRLDRAGERLAVVVPFIKSEVPQLLKSLQLWQTYHPCPSQYPLRGPVELIFYFHVDMESHPDIAQALKEAIKPVASCFGKVSFLSARLKSEEDTYPLGASLMFFRLLTLNRIRQFASIYLMESDNHPCQSGWLSQLYDDSVIGQPFWMKGSMIRNGNEEVGAYVFADHINGNALYRVSDGEFLAFIQRVSAIFSLEPSKFVGSYDIAIYMARRDRQLFTFSEYGATQHKFVYSDTMQNWYRTPINATLLCTANLATFLVHGRNVFR